MSRIKFVIAMLFIAGLFAAATHKASAYPPFVAKAKKFGAKDCRFCHVDPMGGPPWNERGKWLIAEKKRRKADAVDVEWLADYQPGGKAPAKPAAGSATVEEEILKLDRQWLDAYEKGDAATLARIEADEFMVTYADGKVLTKAQEIELVKKDAGSGASLKLSSEEPKVRVYGNTAVVTGIFVQRSTQNGQERVTRERFTDVWAKRNGRWQAVATALTTIPQPQPAPDKKPQEAKSAGGQAKGEAGVYDDYVGDYETPLFLLHIIKVGDKLYGEPEGDTREELLPEAENRFKVTNVNAVVTFIKAADGKITGLDLLLNGQKHQGKKVK